MDSDTHKLEPQDSARMAGTLVAPPPPIAPPAMMERTILTAPPPPPAPAVPGAPPDSATTADVDDPPEAVFVAPFALPETPMSPGVFTTPLPPAPHPVPQPATPPPPPATPIFGSNSNIIPIALIVLGGLLLFMPFDPGEMIGSAIVLIIGLSFLYTYTQSGRFGFLVPGAIMSGLGAGIVMEAMSTSSGWVPLGLGLGFCAIWFLHRAHWWALIPGGIITLAGLQDLASSNSWVRGIWHSWNWNGGSWWPLFLILAGIWLIAARNNRNAHS